MENQTVIKTTEAKNSKIAGIDPGSSNTSSNANSSRNASSNHGNNTGNNTGNVPGNKSNVKIRADKIANIHKYIRIAVQLGFFIALPSLYSSAFAGIRYVFTQIGLKEMISLTPFTAILLILCGYTVIFGRFFCGYACAFGSIGDWIHMIHTGVSKRMARSSTVKKAVIAGTPGSTYAPESAGAPKEAHTNGSAQACSSKKTDEPKNANATGAAGPGTPKKARRGLPSIPAAVMRFLSWIKYILLAAIVLMCFFGKYSMTRGMDPWDVFAQIRSGQFNLSGYLIGCILLGLIFAGMFFNERFFCRVLCPMGAVFSLLPVLPLFSLHRDRSSCIKGCKACTRSCPSDIELPELGHFEICSDCFQCHKCIDSCPKRKMTPPCSNVRCGIRQIHGNEIVFTVIRAGILAAVIFFLIK